ncbi:hypothetical protein V8G54_033994 [Vigna mungo]|uniref:Uncharacterized protein n=1 Tax=Vigna mungo TaxID=3915 RepID=A0AAQ3MPA8_VIGMU
MALVSSSCSKGHTTSFSQMRLSITQPSQVLQHHHQCHLHLLIQYLSYIIIDSTKHFNHNSLKVTTSSTSPPLHCPLCSIMHPKHLAMSNLKTTVQAKRTIQAIDFLTD